MKKVTLLLAALFSFSSLAAAPGITQKTIEIQVTDKDFIVGIGLPSAHGGGGEVAGSQNGGFATGGAQGGGHGGAQGGSQGGTGGGTGGGPEIPPMPTGTGPFDRIGQVLSVASTVVALGESVYTLLQHGKPSAKTDFAPISVVPKDPQTKEPVSPFDMEDCSLPARKKFQTVMTTAGVEVVRFEYMVVYSTNCSYDGKGKYIQTAFIQPGTVKVGYGWDVNASMKLSGIMNHGKKADPIVGALLTVKYSMNSWRTAFEKDMTIHITGKGEVTVIE